MTINLTYDKSFAIKSVLVLLLVLTVYGTYQIGYKRGFKQAVKVIEMILNEEEAKPKVSDEDTGGVGHFGA